MTSAIRLCVLLVVAFTASACVSAGTGFGFPAYRHPLLHNQDLQAKPSRQDGPSDRTPEPLEVCADPTPRRLALATAARSMLTKPRFRIDGRLYRRDCSGFVMAVLASAGLPIDKLLGQNGIGGIYQLVAERRLLHRHKVPDVGDLVFFDNTYDRNHDGRTDDPLTHMGIVESVASDGTVSFIHHSRGGILRHKMNLFTPHSRRDHKTGRPRNHYLRLGNGTKPGKRLTGELFCAFASLVR